jgi:NTE family protein
MLLVRQSRPVRVARSAVDLLYGASQLMMQSVIAAKLHQSAPDILLRPPVSRFRVLIF